MTTPSSVSATRRESLGLSGAFDLLEDVDFESTMMVLEQSETTNGGPMAAARRRLSSVLRRGSLEQLDLSLSSLAELFPAGAAAGDSADALSMFSDDQLAAALTHMTNGQSSASPSRRTSVAGAGDLQLGLKVRAPSTSSRSSIAIKAEFPHSPPAMLSPTMDSFLRDSWGDINDLESKTRRTSSKLLEGLLGHSLLSPTGTTPRRLSVKLPGAASLQTTQLGSPTRLGMQALFPSATQGPTFSVVNPLVGTTESKPRTSKPRATAKQPRRAKQCVEPNCPRRAQSNNRCKTHGGGARCQMEGCDKSSQGGGLCRAHGGGKKCRVAGCTKGTQRLGLCYLHGGIRRCIFDGCKKKDRGNGYCISHGGGRRCEVAGCERSVRKGNYCQTHQGMEEDAAGSESPFKISRGHGLNHVS